MYTAKYVCSTCRSCCGPQLAVLCAACAARAAAAASPTWQDVLPEGKVDVVEDVAVWPYVVVALGGEAQRHVVVLQGGGQQRQAVRQAVRRAAKAGGEAGSEAGSKGRR